MTSNALTTAPMTRRRWLRTMAAGTAAAALPLPVPGAGARRPNVVFLLTDDQGSVDINCYGATDLHTPHMDSLAASGVRFTDHYVNAPMCTASRIALLTGRDFHRAFERGRGIYASETTMAELFRDNGYRTGLFGKWHIGGPPHDPLGHGGPRRRCAVDGEHHTGAVCRRVTNTSPWRRPRM